MQILDQDALQEVKECIAVRKAALCLCKNAPRYLATQTCVNKIFMYDSQNQTFTINY